MTGVVTNPKIRFGKPIIKGTRITVEEVLGALASGMEYKEIKKEYGLTKQQVLQAVQYITGWIKGEETKEYAVSPQR